MQVGDDGNVDAQLAATFAGALRYRDYGLLKRLMMKWIARQEGGDTDTSRNYEYTAAGLPAKGRSANASICQHFTGYIVHLTDTVGESRVRPETG